uniref:Uncharacterized protein n=1 Tax=Triticum urartu TaxID=4572 RepID=A0A8R7QNY1_TRIUA
MAAAPYAPAASPADCCCPGTLICTVCFPGRIRCTARGRDEEPGQAVASPPLEAGLDAARFFLLAVTEAAASSCSTAIRAPAREGGSTSSGSWGFREAGSAAERREVSCLPSAKSNSRRVFPSILTSPSQNANSVIPTHLTFITCFIQLDFIHDTSP